MTSKRNCASILLRLFRLGGFSEGVTTGAAALFQWKPDVFPGIVRRRRALCRVLIWRSFHPKSRIADDAGHKPDILMLLCIIAEHRERLAERAFRKIREPFTKDKAVWFFVELFLEDLSNAIFHGRVRGIVECGNGDRRIQFSQRIPVFVAVKQVKGVNQQSLAGAAPGGDRVQI